MKKLIDLKVIFSQQLPKMPKEYIVRLLFDQKHHCLAIKHKQKIFGGICYRMFPQTQLTEVVFLAISAEYQIKGHGSLLMSELKALLQSRDMLVMMTCADNLALGYFKKQGFDKQITVDHVIY